MSNDSGYWCPIAAANDLQSRPLALTRFGKDIVLWRSGDRIVCAPDRCPHRGAALSLGRVENGVLACRFHGLKFSADGSCIDIPVEASPDNFGDFRLACKPIVESDGYVWIWRGRSAAPTPELPRHVTVENLRYGESSSIWPAHYTRCIENVCDFSHLPFVHRTTIGRSGRNPAVQVEIEEIESGFRAYLLNDGVRGQFLEFLYPNLWLLTISKYLRMSAVFAPIDDRQTAVYGRTYFRSQLPGTKTLMNAYTRFSQFLVFREDWPIVASQSPANVADAQHEKLLPSDAPVIAYRKLHRAHEKALVEQETSP